MAFHTITKPILSNFSIICIDINFVFRQYKNVKYKEIN